MNPLLYVWAVNFAIAILIFTIVFTTNISKTRKILVTFLVILSGLLSYRALNQLYGKPVLIQRDIDDVLVLAFSTDRVAGKMYLWIQKPGHEPENYTMPYDASTHRQLMGKRQQAHNGPFYASIKISTNQTNRYDDSVDGSNIEDSNGPDDTESGYPVLPPKQPEDGNE